jgi:serine/threonine protein kinase
MPKFCGYVYEETEDRVIVFLMEDLHGYHPLLGDLELCQNALQNLHSLGIVHGDLNRNNILIETNVVKFLDFEAAKFSGDEDLVDLILVEAGTLNEKLADTSGMGDHGV